MCECLPLLDPPLGLALRPGVVELALWFQDAEPTDPEALSRRLEDAKVFQVVGDLVLYP